MGEESNKWMDNLMYNITYLRKSLGLSEKQMADLHKLPAFCSVILVCNIIALAGASAE